MHVNKFIAVCKDRIMSYAWHSTGELQKMLQTYAGRREEADIRAELNRRQYGGAQKTKKVSVKKAVAKAPAKKTTAKKTPEGNKSSKKKPLKKKSPK